MRDELRRVLQIAVHEHAGILRGDLHAAAKRGLGSEIPRMRDADDAGILRAQGADHLLGVVRAAVVHENDFVVDIELVEHAFQPLGG